jgi:hypothetical protein
MKVYKKGSLTPPDAEDLDLTTGDSLYLGTKNYTEIKILDKQEFNANHWYKVVKIDVEPHETVFADVKFQKGPIIEHGINGCHNEDLLNIVMHRLQCLNRGKFECEENRKAIVALNECLTHLRSRTERRKIAGTEGTSNV